jgi:hypothetical protein
MSRRQFHHVNTVVLQYLFEHTRTARAVVDHDLPAAHERGVDGSDGEVEGQRRVERESQALAAQVFARCP